MSASARAAATRPATARPQAAVIRARRPAAAAASVSARSGGKLRIGFEGGQMPLARRIPKRGFHNIFAKPLESVNVSALEKFEDGAVVDAKALLDAGILSKCTYGVKILGNGEITKKLTVKASAFSESAKAKIEAAGGKAEVV